MLREKIEADFKDAMKKKDEPKLAILRMLKAAFANKQSEKRYQTAKDHPDLKEQELEKESSLTEEEITKEILTMLKKGKQAISDFEKGGREDLVNKEKAEINILQGYLPEQLSDEEIKKMAEQAIRQSGAENLKGMGKAMAYLMPEIKGRAEGSRISQILKDLLS